MEIHGDEYNQVLVADTRDLIFQGDVFECFAGEKNYLGYTVEAGNICGSKGGVPINYDWMTRCFGKEEADKLAEKEIICCGTVIGTVEEMKIFLRTMIKYNPNLHAGGDDQVTQQYIIYNNLLPIKNLIKIDCHNGAILTEYLFHKLYSIQLNGNLILRGDGGIPAIAHQYDRFPELVQLVNDVYREKIFEANLQFADVKSLFEQMLHLIDSEQYSEALQLAVTLIDNPQFNSETFKQCNFSGYFEYLIQSWESVMNKNSQQTPTFELLELSFQNIFMAVFTNVVKEYLIFQFDKVVAITLKAFVGGRTVSENFKIFLVNNLFVLSRRFFQEKNFNQCLQYLDYIEKFKIPLSKNVYQLKAQVYDQLGRKKEAKQIMKKVFSI